MDPVTRLYAAPLEDFVAERKRLAKELRDGGDRAAATEFARLPKPTPPAWALNRVAREHPEVVAAWLGVTGALREAVSAPGPELRGAMAAQREATTRLVALVRDTARPAGRPLSAPMLDRVRALLQAAAVDPERSDALREARVVEGDDAPAAPAQADRVPGGGSGRKTAKRAGRGAGDREAAERAAAEQEAAGRAAAEREAAQRRAELEQRVGAAQAELGRLRDTAGERDTAAAEAAERLEAARRTLHRSESEAEAATDAAAEARTALADAERAAEVLLAQLRDAAG